MANRESPQRWWADDRNSLGALERGTATSAFVLPTEAGPPERILWHLISVFTAFCLQNLWQCKLAPQRTQTDFPCWEFLTHQRITTPGSGPPPPQCLPISFKVKANVFTTSSRAYHAQGPGTPLTSLPTTLPLITGLQPLWPSCWFSDAPVQESDLYS